ncbi:hypothetical protein, partial [Mesorhizobium sp.]
MEAENSYAEQATAHLAGLKAELIAEIEGRQPREAPHQRSGLGLLSTSRGTSGVYLIRHGGAGLSLRLGRTCSRPERN